MEISYFGNNAIKLKSGGEAIGFDLPLSKLKSGGSKDIRAVFYTDSYKLGKFYDKSDKGTLIFESQGEYEVGSFSVVGSAVGSYGEVYKTEKSIVYLVDANDFGPVGVIAYANKKLDDRALEVLSNARVVVIPVGGMGLGLEPEEALDIVKDLNCEYVVPVHYEDGKSAYESPQASVESFLNLIPNSEPQRVRAKINTKSLQSPTEGFKVILIDPESFKRLSQKISN